jgi:hypothetical protein
MAITIRHAKNCALLCQADGVTLLLGVISARKIQKITPFESAAVSVLCHVLERIPWYNPTLRTQIFVHARTVPTCASTSVGVQGKALGSPISIIMATASKHGASRELIVECLQALCACAQSPANCGIIGSIGAALAVKLDRAGYTLNTTILLSLITQDGAFADDSGIIKIATRKTLPAKSTLPGIKHPVQDSLHWKQALQKLQTNLKVQVAP